MTKKLRILVLLIILAFSFTVKAEVFLEIDCNSKEISTEVTCDSLLVYEGVSINDIEFSYQTNLDIEFIPVDGFSINNSNNKLTIHTDTALYDEILNSSVIASFKLSKNDQSNEEENLNFTNIKINNSSDEIIDDVSETFVVKIDKEKELDSICTLDSITIDKEKVLDFDKDKFEYHSIKVQNEVIFIDAVRTSDKSSATGLGNVRIPNGETIERDITVTAEDGSKNIYKLFITNTAKKEEIEVPEGANELGVVEVIKSSDNSLKSLDLYNDKEKIKFDFNSKKDVYDIKIDNGIIEKITIKATLNDKKASFIKNYGPRDIKINYGNNKVLLKVVSEDGKEKTYTLNINYIDSRDKDNTLISLTINDKVVDLTSEDLSVTLPKTIDKLDIKAISTSDKATITYEDESKDIVNIKVTAENGDIKIYSVNILEEEIILSDEESIDTTIDNDDSSNLIYYIIFGFIILLIIIIVLIVYKRKNKKIVIEEI